MDSTAVNAKAVIEKSDFVNRSSTDPVKPMSASKKVGKQLSVAINCALSRTIVTVSMNVKRISLFKATYTCPLLKANWNVRSILSIFPSKNFVCPTLPTTLHVFLTEKNTARKEGHFLVKSIQIP